MARKRRQTRVGYARWVPHCDNATRYGPEDEATSHIRLSLSYLAHTDTLYSEVSYAEGAGGSSHGPHSRRPIHLRFGATHNAVSRPAVSEGQ